jgi:hypothetical protein
MANCVTCGDKLHPERATKYNYCTKPDCQGRNPRSLEMVALGVNKAADQYLILDERTKQQMASGQFKKQADVPARVRRPSHTRAGGLPAHGPQPAARHGAAPTRRWSEAQERLALIYRDMGMTPEQIANKLGLSPYLATQILLAAIARGRR